MKQMNNKKKHKVVLLGSAAVGKSSILNHDGLWRIYLIRSRRAQSALHFTPRLFRIMMNNNWKIYMINKNVITSTLAT